MSYPELSFTSRHTPEPALTPGAAAKLAGTTEHLLKKLIRALYVQPQRDSLEPFIRAEHVSAGGLLPVIQTDAPSPVEEDWRSWAGDGLSLNNEQWIDAQRGDWTGVAVDRVLGAGYCLVGVGGLVTGVTKVNGLDKDGSGDARKVRFDMEILGRLTSELVHGRKYLNPAATPEDRGFAESLLGKRYEPQRGGSVGFI